MDCLPALTTADQLVERTPEIERLLHDLPLAEFERVTDCIFEVFRDVLGYLVAVMHGQLPAFLAENPRWARVGEAIMRAETTALAAEFPDLTLGFTVERVRGRILINSFSRRLAA